MPNVGALVRNARTSKGWSQSHLAEAAGLSKRTVIRAESGVSVAGESLMALGAALGLDLTRSEPMEGGRTLLVYLPEVLTPIWLERIMAPSGFDYTVSIRLLAVYAILTTMMSCADLVGRVVDPAFGDIWFQGSSFVLFLYICLFCWWSATGMIDDWLIRQDPTRPIKISLISSVKD